MTSDPTTGSQTVFLLKSALRQLRWTINIWFSIVFFLLLVIVATGLWLRYDDVLRESRRNAENLVNILSEDLATRIDAINEALRELAAFSRFIGGPNASGEEWMTLLRTVAAGQRGFEALMVTDRGGRITFSSLPMLMGESRAGENAFRILSENPRSDALIADDPIRSSNDSKLVVPLARVIRTPNAEFEGLAIANFAPDQLREFYGVIDVGEHGRIWLMKIPGVVLLREPSSDTPNDEKWPAVLGDAINASESGIETGPVSVGGPDYITAYRSLAESGLTVAVSLAVADVVGPWWNEVYVGLAATVLVGLILTVAAILISRVVRSGETALDAIGGST